MKETALQVHQRKIRNGLRKQAEAYQRDKEKIWDRLKEVKPPPRTLKANWTIEEAVDIQSLHSFDLEKELADELAAELTKEILFTGTRNE